MQPRYWNVQDERGNAVPGAQVTIRKTLDQSIASIFDPISGAALSNPFTVTDQGGEFGWTAADGVYDEITVTRPGVPADVKKGIILYDSAASAVVSVKSFGAKGDGTDESTKIQAAFTSLTITGGSIYYPPGTYRQVGIQVPSNVSVIIDPAATIVQATNADQVFRSDGTLGGSVALTSDAVAGASSLSVASAAGINPGDWLILADTADYSVDSAAVGYKSGESVIVLSVVGSTINLRTPLFGSLQPSGSYTVANGSAIRKVTPVRNVSYSGGGSIQLLQTSNTNGIWTQYVDGVKVNGVNISHFAGAGIFIRDSRNVSISENTIFDGLDNVGAGFPGYAVALGGASDVVTVDKNRMTQVRHGFTTIGGTTGGPTRVKVTNNHAYDCSANCLDTHETGQDILFANNTLTGGQNASCGGINTRTGQTTIQGNTISNMLNSGIGCTGTTVKSNTIRGNKLRNCKGLGITVPGNFPYLAITDNELEEIGDTPITVFGSDTALSPGLLVARNNIYSFGTVVANRNGIVVAGSQANTVTIRDNVIDSASGSVQRAIQLIAPVVGRVFHNEARGSFSVTAFALNALSNFNNVWNQRPREVQFTLANNTAQQILCASSSNLLCQIGSSSSGNGNPNMLFRARTNGSPQCAAVTAAITNVAFTTGVLSGTTGTAGNCTISAATGSIYVENQTGGPLTLWMKIEGPVD